MRKLGRIFSLFLVCLLGLAGCSSAKTAAQTPAATESVTPQPTTQVLRSKTSGKRLDAPVTYKPIGIMIENSPEARPQTGLQAADIVYEAPVEGSYTRFFAIFNDTLPTIVGPVRSARIYYIRFAKEWDCMYVHFGGGQSGEANVYAPGALDSLKMQIDFISGKYNKYYWRSTGRSAPHNAYTDVTKLQTLMNYEAQGRTFLFDENAGSAGEAFAEVDLPFNSSNVSYKYDAAQGVLVRYQGGKEFTDASTKKAITVQNLIVQYNNFYHGNEAKGRWLCDLLGSGKADFFIGGKHVTGTWERTSLDSPTIYKDASGNEIVLRPGNTWIAVHPDNVSITVK